MSFLFAARFTRRAEDLNGPIAGFGVPLLVLGGTFSPIELFPDALVALALQLGAGAYRRMLIEERRA